MVRNTMKLVERAIGTIKPFYDLYYKNIVDIEAASNNNIEMISNSFYFGYMQGYKAAKSDMKKVI